MAQSKQKCREIDEDIAQQLNRKQSIVFLEEASGALFFDQQEWQTEHPGQEYPKPLARAWALIREEIEERKRGDL
jgi:hypothetical protein